MFQNIQSRADALGTFFESKILGPLMKMLSRIIASFVLLTAAFQGTAYAATYAETVQIFKDAGQSASFFSRSYGYAVFPNIGSGAVGIGGAYGKGRVYVGGNWVGYTNMKQVSIGFQAGGKSYSQIVFFQDKRSFEDFTSGKFEFGADASVTAVTAGANATAGTDGVTKGTSQGQHDASNEGQYNSGMAVFVVAKGGLMAGASVAGQKFEFQTRSQHAAEAEAKAAAE